MIETAFDKFWQLVSGAIALDPEAFKLIETLPGGIWVGLLVVLLGGFSRAIGQGIVLFINRVRPLRFILSLAIAAILFAFSYIFWVISTWIVSHLIFRDKATFLSMVRTLGLAYAPQILSFFIALPYLGVPISTILSVWSFLAFARGLQVVAGVEMWQAFWYSVLGFLVFEVLQRTIGRPFEAIGRWLTNTAAGVRLATNLKEVEKLLENGVQSATGRRSRQ